MQNEGRSAFGGWWKEEWVGKRVIDGWVCKRKCSCTNLVQVPCASEKKNMIVCLMVDEDWSIDIYIIYVGQH